MTRFLWDDVQILQILASALGCAALGFGISGAILVTELHLPKLMLFGFGCWIVGNWFLIRIEWPAGHTWLAVMFAFYEVLALVGFWNAAGAM